MANESRGTVNAPEFPSGLEWLNTDHSISLRDLRGKVVLLDFWTFCCINCMHVIPDLKRLEKKYKNEMVVIGVHSAKFTSERETANIREAILRYGVEHPVINDREMTVWNEYAVRAWPTLVLIDPTGKIVARASGERTYGPFDQEISRLVLEFDAQGKLDRRPLKLKPEKDHVPEGILDFPGKVLADQTSGQLFITDSNHNRIIVAGLSDREVKFVAGSGEGGFKDGKLAEAEFNHPQGTAFDGRWLYVADTENHAIRRIDFAAGRVETIAGTGQQASRDSEAGQGTTTPLNSPWALALQGKALYIAMAGAHQIWKMDLVSGHIGPWAGTGREGRRDGAAAEAWFAQPSGLATDGKELYVADSEDSSIREVDLTTGNVRTIAGGDLFVYGDTDGTGDKARFQHPLGVAYVGGLLYVADTYNNKIKIVSPEAGTAKSFLGTKRAGYKDGQNAAFSEPGGLSIAGGKVYIADTNNHAIRIADLKGGRVETLDLKGLDRLAPGPGVTEGGDTIQLAEQTVSPGAVTLAVTVDLPGGYMLNKEAPSSIRIFYGDASRAPGSEGEKTVKNPRFPLRLPVTVPAGESTLKAEFTLYYCEEKKESLCYFKQARLILPIKGEEASGGHRLSMDYKITQN